MWNYVEDEDIQLGDYTLTFDEGEYGSMNYCQISVHIGHDMIYQDQVELGNLCFEEFKQDTTMFNSYINGVIARANELLIRLKVALRGIDPIPELT